MRRADLERFDRRSVAWFLRLYGAALVVNVLLEVRAGVWRVHTGELYPWRHIPLVPLYPPAGLAIEWLATATTGVALAAATTSPRAGRVARVAARVAALATLAGVLQRYSNHGVLLFLIALYVAIDPPDVAAADFGVRPHPALGLVRAQLAIVYLFTALNKITHGFLGGAAIAALFGWSAPLARAAAWAVIAAELALPFVLVRWPRAGVAGVLALHLAFAAWMPGLWSFALAMLSMATLFLGSAPSRADADQGPDGRPRVV